MHAEPSRVSANRLFLICAGQALVWSAAPVMGQQAYEVSEDGSRAALVTSRQSFAARGSSGVPFPLVPDVTVELRRQIGGLQIADMDGDGLNDLVAVCYISNSFPPYEDWHDMIFFGTPSGVANTPAWISDVETHTGDVQIGDVTGDGLPDIVTIHGGGVRTDSVRVYPGSATGPATAPSYQSNVPGRSWGTAGVLADMDLDGDLDLVTTNQGLSPDPFRPMLMFRNEGGTLTSNAVWQSAESSIQNGIDARDITGDGYPDLAVAKWVNFNSAIYHNTTGTPDVNPFVMVPTDGTDRGAVFMDLETDGVSEIVFGGSPTQIYDNGPGALVPRVATQPPFAGPQDVRVADIDGDGDEDLGEIMFSDGRAHLYLNNNGTLDPVPAWTFDASEVGTAMAIGDLNNDGRVDLALGYSGNTCIRVFYAQAPDCPADLAEPFGTLNFFDIAAFIALYNAGDLGADLAEPLGTLNFFDIAEYVAQFNAGCP